MLTFECCDVVLVPDESSILEGWECLLVTSKYGTSNVACGAENKDLLVFVGHTEMLAVVGSSLRASFGVSYRQIHW